MYVTGDLVGLSVRVPKPLKDAIYRMAATQKISIGSAARVYLAAGAKALEEKHR